MDRQRKDGARGTPATSHDFFTCDDCKDEGKRVRDAIGKIERWSEALVTLSPPAAVDLDLDGDPEEFAPGGINGATLTEALGHAIFYEAERLGSNLPGIALCEAARLNRAIDTIRISERAGEPLAVAR
jgi:hypothetical protein